MAPCWRARLTAGNDLRRGGLQRFALCAGNGRRPVCSWRFLGQHAFGEPRLTNDVDILADFSPASLDQFLGSLPSTFYVDPEEARTAIGGGRPFNVIHIPMAFKFDFFPARAFPLGVEELDRAIVLAGSGLSELPTPFVTPEDILLAKLHWFRAGGEVSEVQWRDIQGIVHNCSLMLDRGYLERSAAKLELSILLERALAEE